MVIKFLWWQVPRIELISSKSAILVYDMLYVFIVCLLQVCVLKVKLSWSYHNANCLSQCQVFHAIRINYTGPELHSHTGMSFRCRYGYRCRCWYIFMLAMEINIRARKPDETRAMHPTTTFGADLTLNTGYKWRHVHCTMYIVSCTLYGYGTCCWHNLSRAYTEKNIDPLSLIFVENLF